jgi:hypothetical protein
MSDNTRDTCGKPLPNDARESVDGRGGEKLRPSADAAPPGNNANVVEPKPDTNGPRSSPESRRGAIVAIACVVGIMALAISAMRVDKQHGDTCSKADDCGKLQCAFQAKTASALRNLGAPVPQPFCTSPCWGTRKHPGGKATGAYRPCPATYQCVRWSDKPVVDSSCTRSSEAWELKINREKISILSPAYLPPMDECNEWKGVCVPADQAKGDLGVRAAMIALQAARGGFSF